MSMHAEALEADSAQAKALINAVITATGRSRRALEWRRFRGDLYGADWSNVCSLLLVHSGKTSELYVVDNEGMHEPIAIKSAWYGPQCENLLKELELAIKLQIKKTEVIMEPRVVVSKTEWMRHLERIIS